MEVEVWPADAEVYFSDERYADPVNTQVRFDAVVYNAPTDRVTWEVRDLTGGPGAGHIDPSGLYTAPPKGTLPHGLTDVVIATSVDDPLRSARAHVSLIGRGPEPAPEPLIEVFPRQTYLYYQAGNAPDHNEFIDKSNKVQLFRAVLHNVGSAEEIEWLENGIPVWSSTVPWHLYTAPIMPDASLRVVTITARLKARPQIRDDAKVKLINYRWPGIVPIVYL